MTYTAPGGSSVQINRIRGTWTWSVSVEAQDSSPDQLQEAKQKALKLAFELQDDIHQLTGQPQTDDNQQADEIPF
jgi:hypothetical protein